jgi:hypothetical protein
LPGRVTLAGVSPNFQYQITQSGASLVFNAVGAAAPVNQWEANVSASWGTAENWNLSVPNAPGAEAQFLRRGSTPGAAITVTLDGNRTVGSLTFDSPDGYVIAPGTGGQLMLNNGGDPRASVRILGGQHVVTAQVMAGSPTIDVQAEASTKLTLAGGLSAPATTLVKSGKGVLALGGGINVNTLTINGGVVQIARGTAAPNPVGTLSVNTGADLSAALDLTDGRVMLTATPGASVRQMLVSGYANGAWTGSGINSSVAAAENGVTSLGYALSGDGFGLPATGGALIRYTKSGDATLDGTVDFNDLVALAQNYNTTLAGDSWWVRGDFTYDGVVDFNDLVKLAQNYNTSLAAGPVPGAPAGFDADLAAAFVPEPAAVVTLLPVAFAWATRRRRATRPR